MRQSSATIFRRETIPLHTMMAENPHYESQQSSSNSDSKEDPDKVTIQFFRVQQKPDYQVISSLCLNPIKELGEGVFGKVHLATYCASPEQDGEKFLVAVSIKGRVV